MKHGAGGVGGLLSFVAQPSTHEFEACDMQEDTNSSDASIQTIKRRLFRYPSLMVPYLYRARRYARQLVLTGRRHPRVCIIGLAVCGAFGMLFAGLLGILAFGKPEWSPVIVYFQGNVYPGEQPAIPDDFTGVWETYWRIGTVLEQVEVVQGQRHGRYALYDETGPVMCTGYYSDDLKDGVWVYYDPDGTIDGIYHYSMGKPVKSSAPSTQGATGHGSSVPATE
jgi:hypothetical protein